ncbi:hypothetical protein F7725_012255 [Dissostichus mawsoni]|uniref:Uncharacterized protein n=1 Tax=Dissostichus mawsoni TaxID=36200 RepID=A0A7J5YMZ2_DISMA|nr:hypothetical protein F7725_012255 [Dissostichus mawsoni]
MGLQAEGEQNSTDHHMLQPCWGSPSDHHMLQPCWVLHQIITCYNHVGVLHQIITCYNHVGVLHQIITCYNHVGVLHQIITCYNHVGVLHQIITCYNHVGVLHQIITCYNHVGVLHQIITCYNHVGVLHLIITCYNHVGVLHQIITCYNHKLLQPNISVSSSMYGVSGAQQQGFQVFRGSTFTISCSIQPQYPGGSFQLNFTSINSANTTTQSQLSITLPTSCSRLQSPPTREATAELLSESRLLSVTVTDPEPFIIRAVVLPLTLPLLVTIGLYFYCHQGAEAERQEDIELDYDDLGVPAEEEGAQGAESSHVTTMLGFSIRSSHVTTMLGFSIRSSHVTTMLGFSIRSSHVTTHVGVLHQIITCYNHVGVLHQIITCYNHVGVLHQIITCYNHVGVLHQIITCYNHVGVLHQIITCYNHVGVLHQIITCYNHVGVLHQIITCYNHPQYPGGSFLLSSSTHNYTQPAVNHSAHFLFPAAEPAHQGNYSCVITSLLFSDLSSESRLLSVTVTDPEPFIIRAVVLPLTQLLVTIGLYFYCKATRGRRPSRQEDIELDYDDLGVPAEEEGAQGAE